MNGKKNGQNRVDKNKTTKNIDKGLQEILSHAQSEIRSILLNAIEKEHRTGQNLVEILRQDVDKEMFKSIWSFLNKPISVKGSGGKGKLVKERLLEGGFITQEELDHAEQTGEAYDESIGRHLVKSGYITEQQLEDALVQQERTGQSSWRILVNKGLVTPKQIADARKYGGQFPGAVMGDQELKNACIRTGLVTEEEAEQAVETAKAEGRNMLQVLVDSGEVSKSEIGKALAGEVGIEWLDVAKLDIEPSTLNLLPEYLARESRMLPIAKMDGKVRVAMANPLDVACKESFHILVDMDMEPILAFEQDILDAINTHYSRKTGEKRQRDAVTPKKDEGALDKLKKRLTRATSDEQEVVSLAEDAGVISLVASIIEGAINSRATDIHLEPQAGSLRVRYRLDGMLYDIMNLPERLRDEVISRVKVLAELDITERRRPQDGHFTIQLDQAGREYDIRVATLPTVLGEKIALRLLNPEDLFMGLRELGLEPDQLVNLDENIDEPHGMILATGPIGSGKTTTLYALLSEVDILTQNVVTIEDPVEYQLPGINQVQVDRRVERTFAQMLRSVVRQDANVLMVGEIRDAETAHVAVEAAGTGHLVLSTMHTSDTAGAIVRLKNLEVPSFLIANSITTVVAQRLVRCVCQNCREEYEPDPALIENMHMAQEEVDKTKFYMGKGCDLCFHTGYKGRTGIFEVMDITPEIRHLILAGSDRSEIVEKAIEEGMLTLRQSGLKKVMDGITTLEEVARVHRRRKSSVV